MREDPRRPVGRAHAPERPDAAAAADHVVHYESLLAPVYTWMLGGDAAALAASRRLVADLDLVARDGQVALDLGCGPGHHARALAERGVAVVAIDSSARLTAELRRASARLPITVVLGDIRGFRAMPGVSVQLAKGGFDLVACLGDTLPHLRTAEEARRLVSDAVAALADTGVLIVSLRDYTGDADGSERLVVPRSTPRRAMTCLLRGTATHVVVTDSLYERRGGRWVVQRSTYAKLRIAPRLVVQWLGALGLAVSARAGTDGLWTIVARRRGATADVLRCARRHTA